MSPALEAHAAAHTHPPTNDAEIIDRQGHPAAHAAGAWQLVEGQTYTLRAPAQVSAAHLSGLDLGPRGAGGGFTLALPFAVGRYALALVEGEHTRHHAVEVRPAQAKADPATWMALLDDLEAWLPGLVTGAEGAAVGGVGTVGFASPLLVEALLRSAGFPVSSYPPPTGHTAEALGQLIHDQILATFMEDVEVLQAQQKLIETDERGRPEISVRADLGSVSARRVVQRLIEQETLAAAAPASTGAKHD
jgi:hypothetical protein